MSNAFGSDAPAAGSAFAAESLFASSSPSPAASAFASSPLPGFGPPPPPSFAPPPPAASAGPAPAAIFGAESPGDDDEAHVREVYEQFIATKQQCGESAAGLTLDKFRQRLQENRKALMAKHDCRSVRFSVYIKEGKASLRATPIK